MTISRRLRQLLLFVEDPNALAELIRSPQFSFTSYGIVATLDKLGVRPRSIIDVGANVGQFSMAALRRFPNVTVHAVEPLPDCIASLQSHAVKSGRLVVHAAAAGATEGTTTFHVNASKVSSSVLPLGQEHLSTFPDATETGTIQVRIVRLDEQFADTPLERPTLLKLDVQGYESEALRGAEGLLPRVDWILLEASIQPLYQGERSLPALIAQLERVGFALSRVVGSMTSEQTGAILQIDALFARSTSSLDVVAPARA